MIRLSAAADVEPFRGAFLLLRQHEVEAWQDGDQTLARLVDSRDPG